ncbi:MAG TPA: TetR/AcrR family transcriptional regulator [Pseudonocardia sp.]
MEHDGADLLQRALAPGPTDETAHRILGAAATQAEEFGLRRFTIDEVARRVGLSRVTVYRYFPKKDQLVNALILRELRRFLTQLDAVVDSHPTSVAKLTEGVLFCLDYLRSHRLLSRLLRTEPEFILPHLTTKAGPVIAAARDWIGRLIRAEITAGRVSLPDQDVDLLAELLVRIVISLVISPDTALPIDDPAARRRLVQLYLNPIVAALHPPPK